MRRFVILLAAFVLATGWRSADSLAHAGRAQELLGPGVWSRTIRLESQSTLGRPRVDVGVVFELEGILWLYMDRDGTQSLSQYRGRAEADKADIGPLLRAVDPDLKNWSYLPDAPPPVPGAKEELPNGCFIESVSLLRRCLMLGTVLSEPRLLVYYMPTPGGTRGHTVLTYEVGEVLQVIDPDNPEGTRRLALGRGASAAKLAKSLRRDVTRALWLPLGDFTDRRSPLYVAALHQSAPAS